MEMISSFFRFFLIFFIVRTIFNNVFKVRVTRKKEIEHVTIHNSEELSEQIKKETAIDMVYDKLCNIYVAKSKAYQVVEEDGTHYFCSWECRQKYIDTSKK